MNDICRNCGAWDLSDGCVVDAYPCGKITARENLKFNKEESLKFDKEVKLRDEIRELKDVLEKCLWWLSEYTDSELVAEVEDVLGKKI